MTTTWQEKVIARTKPVCVNAPHFLNIAQYETTEWIEITKAKGEAGLPESATLIGTDASGHYFVGWTR